MNRIYVILLSAPILACSSSSDTTKPTAAQYDDTAQAIASTTASSGSGNAKSHADAATGGGDVASMAIAVAISLGVTPSGFSLLSEGHFKGNRLGVDYSYAMTCKSVLGVVGLCGPTTDQATVDVTWSGTQTSAHADATVSRDGTWMVTGLQSGTATFSGDSTFSFDATLRSVFRPNVTAMFSFDAQASYDAILVSTEQRQVTGGSAAFQISAHDKISGTGSNDVDVAFDAMAELTFHADQTAALVIDGTEHYTINVATGVVVRVN